MSSRKIGIAAMAVLALGAVFAQSAFAGSAVTKTSSWTNFNGGVPTKLPAEESISCSKPFAAPNFVFKGTVAGAGLELEATGVECVASALENLVQGGSNMALGEGSLKFTGMTVKKPVGCKTPATNTTNTRITELRMDSTETKKSFLKFAPLFSGTFTTISLEGCAAEGKYSVSGSLFTQMVNNTNVYSATQEFVGNVTTHAMSSLSIAANPLTFTGTVGIQLSGANKGAFWGAEEK